MDDFRVYSIEDVEKMNLNVDLLDGTKQLIDIKQFDSEMFSIEKGIRLSKDGYYYKFTFPGIMKINISNLIKFFKRYQEYCFLRLDKQYDINCSGPLDLVEGYVKPLNFMYDTEFNKKDKYIGRFVIEFEDESIECEEYKKAICNDRIMIKCSGIKEYAVDIIIENKDEIAVMIEEICTDINNKCTGKCLHFTISEEQPDICSHIDFSINKYNGNILETQIQNIRIDAEERMHFFRINNAFEVNEVLNLANIIFVGSSFVYEVDNALMKYLKNKT